MSTLTETLVQGLQILSSIKKLYDMILRYLDSTSNYWFDHYTGRITKTQDASNVIQNMFWSQAWIQYVLWKDHCLVITVKKDIKCHAKYPSLFLPTLQGTKEKRRNQYISRCYTLGRRPVQPRTILKNCSSESREKTKQDAMLYLMTKWRSI